MAVTLLEIFEQDHVGVLVLLRLLGFPEPEPDDQSGADAEPAELVVLAAEAFARLVDHPPVRLLERLACLRTEGWTVSLEEPTEGPSLRPPTGSGWAPAEAAAGELRPAILWAVCLRAAEALLGVEPPTGCYDLHSRAGGAAAGQLSVLDPEEVLALLTSSAPLLDQASATLRLLPALRSRLLLVLRSALDLSAEEVVSVLCDRDPEGAELVEAGEPSESERAVGQIHRARCHAMGKIRVQQDRARQSIEDALNSGREDLSELLRSARQAPLPELIERLLSEWEAANAPDPRGRRRARSMARLAHLKEGPTAAASLRPYLLVPMDALKESEELLWTWAATGPYRFPDDLRALAAGGSPRRTTAFLLRYVTWVHAGDRPGRETLGEVLYGAPRDREAGERASRELFRARESILAALRRPPVDAPPPPRARPPGPPTGWIPGLVSGARATRAEHAVFRQSLRLQLERRAQRSTGSAPAPSVAAWSERARAWLGEWLPRWTLGLGEGFPLSLQLAPVLGASAGSASRRVILSLAPPPHARAWRPVVVCRAAQGDRVVLPAEAARWPPLDSFPVNDGRYRVAVHEDPGTEGWLILLVPPGLVVDWDASPVQRWTDLRHAASQGRLLAAEAVTPSATVDSGKQDAETARQRRQRDADPRGGQ